MGLIFETFDITGKIAAGSIVLKEPCHITDEDTVEFCICEGSIGFKTVDGSERSSDDEPFIFLTYERWENVMDKLEQLIKEKREK